MLSGNKLRHSGTHSMSSVPCKPPLPSLSLVPNLRIICPAAYMRADMSIGFYWVFVNDSGACSLSPSHRNRLSAPCVSGDGWRMAPCNIRFVGIHPHIAQCYPIFTWPLSTTQKCILALVRDGAAPHQWPCHGAAASASSLGNVASRTSPSLNMFEWCVRCLLRRNWRVCLLVGSVETDGEYTPLCLVSHRVSSFANLISGDGRHSTVFRYSIHARIQRFSSAIQTSSP